MINTNAARQFVPDESSMWEFLCPYLVTVLQPSHGWDQVWRFPPELEMSVWVQDRLSVWWRMGEEIFTQLLPPAIMSFNTGYLVEVDGVETKEVCNTLRKSVCISVYFNGAWFY